MNQKNIANSLTHKNDYCDSSLKRKIVRIKRHAEKMFLLNKKVSTRLINRRSWMDKLEELALQVSPEAATRGVSQEKEFLEVSKKFTGKHLCQRLF